MGHTAARESDGMNTTQNTQRVIATALVAVTAGLALSSCAERPIPAPVQQLSNAQIAELRAGYLDLAERRAHMYRELAEQRGVGYADQSQRRAGTGDNANSDTRTYLDPVERRGGLSAERPSGYLDQVERRLLQGH
jgi:hypothetical protein